MIDINKRFVTRMAEIGMSPKEIETHFELEPFTLHKLYHKELMEGYERGAGKALRKETIDQKRAKIMDDLRKRREKDRQKPKAIQVIIHRRSPSKGPSATPPKRKSKCGRKKLALAPEEVEIRKAKRREYYRRYRVAYQAKYREENAEKLRAWQRENYRLNPEKQKARSRDYYARHRDEIREKKRLAYLKKKEQENAEKQEAS